MAYGGRLDDPREYVKALGLMLVPFACIMTQPDLARAWCTYASARSPSW
ncbi:MAG: hypothetical protein ACLSGS_04255 [Adlercreutzia sp.]